MILMLGDQGGVDKGGVDGSLVVFLKISNNHQNKD